MFLTTQTKQILLTGGSGFPSFLSDQALTARTAAFRYGRKRVSCHRVTIVLL